MLIKNADIFLRSYDRLDGMEMFGCNIACDFDLFNKSYVATSVFEVREYFADKSQDFRLVFENASMDQCIIKGTDKP